MIAIYARQSVDKKDSISIESQIDYAKREVFQEEFKIYQDSGYSGKNTNRPSFVQMMKDIQAGMVKKVVVYRLDRISRSIVDFADFIHVLEEKGVAFVSATEKFDTSTPMGRAMLYIIVVFAQLERETIAERVRDNYYARVKKGAWGGGPAAFGYELARTTIDGKKATIYRPTPALSVVKKMFQIYCGPSATLRTVQKALIEDGVLSAGGVNFDNGKIASILKNPAYVKADLAIYHYYKKKGAILANEPEEFDGVHGCILVGKRDANQRKYQSVDNHLLAIGHHDGIIDSSTFLYCQEKLAQNRQIKNTGKGKYTWLTGLVHCAYCGYAFSVRFGNTKKGKIPYFACSGRYLHHCCDMKQAHRVREVEASVEKILMKEAQKYQLQKEKQTTNEQQEIQQQIRQMDVKIDHLVSSLESVGAASASYINRRIEQLHQEKECLEQKYHQSLLHANMPFVPAFSAEDWYAMDIEAKRKIAGNLIGNVFLSAAGMELDLR